MTKREKYFLKQKLTGLGALAFAVAVTPILWIYEAVLGSVVLAALGVFLIFTKNMVIVDDYFFEVQEDEGL